MSRRSGACLRCCLVIFAVVSALAVCGPALYWRFKKGVLVARSKSSCPSCVCDCPPPLSLLTIAPGIYLFSLCVSVCESFIFTIFFLFCIRVVVRFLFCWGNICFRLKMRSAHYSDLRFLICAFALFSKFDFCSFRCWWSELVCTCLRKLWFWFSFFRLASLSNWKVELHI